MTETANPLQSYVDRGNDPPEFRFRSRSTDSDLHHGTHYELGLRSQTWRDHEWTHLLDLYVPRLTPDEMPVFLQVSGSRTFWKRRNWAAALSDTTRYAVAVLKNVPNQPLFGGRIEDDLIAHTFDKYLDTGDESWPLLLPMTRAATQAMSAVDRVLETEFDVEPTEHIVSGASKRGWTAWLTAAVDSRVTGLVPMVFDNLHFRKQLRHQVDTWGTYSEQISDYIDRDLDQKLESERGQKLLDMTDPYTFRNQLTQPRCIVSATNDRYWPLTANNLYLDDLPGPTQLVIQPNTGHALQTNQQPLYRTLVHLLRSFDGGPARPTVSSSVNRSASPPEFHIDLDAPPLPDRVTLFTAESGNGDFRNATWSSAPIARDLQEARTISTKIPENAPFVGLFGRMVYNTGHQKFSYTTRISVIES